MRLVYEKVPTEFRRNLVNVTLMVDLRRTDPGWMDERMDEKTDTRVIA